MIDIYLPKLRVLCLNYHKIDATEQTADSLSQLSTLESLELGVNNNSIRDLIVDKVMKNCTKIKSIQINV